ncbi:MAG: nitrate reductase molybdenum cofactor assembly chaperone [Steroidobacteraceae bacterium]|nr:nitrate reductase molybdenum cofactor assembly chaperone [Pseudomonadota bacterium]MBP6106785.1 nitrate reductase molybdenum cofactor assembly chaperone [Steroidobacteraceae bacterium]MBP7014784.1 nitrate reductase molybdenum cofactor assembly chaperone [Steroidobacteraceae bacterium]
MKTLKLLSVVLDYPSDELWPHRAELLDAAAVAEVGDRRAELVQFVTDLLALDPLSAQERWLGLFDRGRSMSLLLFEHIHGESRDRGQAMVNLIETYRKGGLELASRELPDYLPLMLEYLSRRPEPEVVDWLSHTRHIVGLLAARAGERGSPYALLFELLIEIGRNDVDLGAVRRSVAAEARDDTPEAMDRVWEEEAVRFGAEAPPADCPPPRRPAAAKTANESRVTR